MQKNVLACFVFLLKIHEKNNVKKAGKSNENNILTF